MHSACVARPSAQQPLPTKLTLMACGLSDACCWLQLWAYLRPVPDANQPLYSLLRAASSSSLCLAMSCFPSCVNVQVTIVQQRTLLVEHASKLHNLTSLQLAEGRIRRMIHLSRTAAGSSHKVPVQVTNVQGRTMLVESALKLQNLTSLQLAEGRCQMSALPHAATLALQPYLQLTAHICRSRTCKGARCWWRARSSCRT